MFARTVFLSAGTHLPFKKQEAFRFRMTGRVNRKIGTAPAVEITLLLLVAPQESALKGPEQSPIAWSHGSSEAVVLCTIKKLQ